MPPFDACIDLTVRTVPEGVAPRNAVERVRLAVEALPGTEWISLKWCGDGPGDWLWVFPAGVGRKQEDGEWAELRDSIVTTLREADGGLEARVGDVAGTGRQSRSQLDQARGRPEQPLVA